MRLIIILFIFINLYMIKLGVGLSVCLQIQWVVSGVAGKSVGDGMYHNYDDWFCVMLILGSWVVDGSVGVSDSAGAHHCDCDNVWENVVKQFIPQIFMYGDGENYIFFR